MSAASSTSFIPTGALTSVLDSLFLSLIELSDSWLFVHALIALPALLLLSNLIWQRVRCDFDAAVEGYYDYCAATVSPSTTVPDIEAPAAACPKEKRQPVAPSIRSRADEAPSTAASNGGGGGDDLHLLAAAGADIGCSVTATPFVGTKGAGSAGDDDDHGAAGSRTSGQLEALQKPNNSSIIHNRFVSLVVVADTAVVPLSNGVRASLSDQAQNHHDPTALPTRHDLSSDKRSGSGSSAGTVDRSLIVLTRPLAAKVSADATGGSIGADATRAMSTQSSALLTTSILNAGLCRGLAAATRRRRYRAFFLFLMAWQLHAGWFAAYASMVSPAWVPTRLPQSASMPASSPPLSSEGFPAPLPLQSPPPYVPPQPTPLMDGATYAAVSWVQGVLTAFVVAAWLAVVTRPAFMRVFAFEPTGTSTIAAAATGDEGGSTGGSAVTSRLLAALDLVEASSASSITRAASKDVTSKEEANTTPHQHATSHGFLTLRRFTAVLMSPPQFYLQPAAPTVATSATSGKGRSGGGVKNNLMRVFHHTHADSEARSYCRQCNAIVVGRDHHCWWLGVCIGRANRWRFLTLCWAGVALGVYDVVVGSVILLTWARRAAWMTTVAALFAPPITASAISARFGANLATGSGGDCGWPVTVALMPLVTSLVLWTRAITASAGSDCPFQAFLSHDGATFMTNALGSASSLASGTTGASLSTMAVPSFQLGNAVTCAELVLGVLLSLALVAVCGGEALAQTRLLLCRGGATKLGDRIRRAAARC